jgi:hypothetical protein
VGRELERLAISAGRVDDAPDALGTVAGRADAVTDIPAADRAVTSTDNRPPRHEMFAMALDDVRLEAGNFLDGQPIENKAQADKIGIIVSKARAIKRDADLARKEDKEPHLEAGRKVDADYKPVLETAEDIISAAQRPLTAWMEAEATRQRQEAEEARKAALQAQQAALEAQRASDGNVDATEAARKLQKDADGLTRQAARAEKAKPNVAGEGRAIGLRTYWKHEIADRRELLNWVAKNDAAALTAFLEEYARKAVASGARWLPTR